MADTGKIAVEGFSAGAIKYVVLGGFVTDSSAGPVNACLVTLGFGVATTHKVALLGFVGASAPPTTSGAYYIFGDTVVR